MKVALIRPPAPAGDYVSQEAFVPPLGIGYLASFLRSKKISTVLFDGIIESMNVHEITRRIIEERIGIAAISAMTPEIQSAHALATAIKSKASEIKTVIGGVHAIAMPVDTIEEFSSFDYLIKGEGEISLWELVQRVEKDLVPKGIQGVVWRKDGKTVQNKERPWIEALDELPFPAWDLFARKSPCYFLLSSRGCPFQCNFCMRALGDRVRYRNPENVVEEMVWLITCFQPKRIIFQDETFTLHRRRTETLLDLMIQKGVPRKIRWVVQTRVDMVDPPLLNQLKRAGCYRIEFGIESGHPEILKGTRKGTQLSKALESVKEAKKAGLFVSCSFIFGHPNETKETIRKTIRFCQSLNPDNATFGIMVPYPKTEIALMVKNRTNGYVQGPDSWQDYTRFSEKGIELESIKYRDMKKLQVEAYLRYFVSSVRLLSLSKYLYSHRKQVFLFLRNFSRKRKNRPDKHDI